VLAAVAGWQPSAARAESLDPVVWRRLRIGAPAGFAPSDRIDARRTGRSRSRLPFPPVELWRRQLGGQLDVDPVVDAGGNVIAVLGSSDVVKLGPDGKELWRTRLGGGTPLASPVLLSDDTIVIIGGTGQAMGLSPAGALRFSAHLGIRAGRDEVLLLSLDDGGFVVGSGRSVVELGGDGAVRSRATLEERLVGGLVAGPSGTLVTGEQGSVFELRPPAPPRRIGTLRGAASGGASLADARTLVAVVDGRRVTSLDLPTGTTIVWSGASAPGAQFDTPLTITREGRALTASYAGLLVAFDSAGNELVHVALDKQLPPSAGDGGTAALAAFLGAVELRASPPVILDPDGRVGFARATGRVGVVGPEGAVVVASERLCGAPISVQPAGEKRMVVACRDGGSLWMIGE
jgi:outer membrane protein assembly factor BamB